MTVRPKSALDLDPTNPPAGARLAIGTVAATLQVSISDMEQATGLGRGTVFRLLSNEWPARSTEAERQAIRQALTELFVSAGATPEQLRTLFMARASGLGRTMFNRFNRSNRPDRSQPTPEEPDMLLAKQTLSPQARRHFKLFTSPFDGEVQKDEHFFCGADIRWARESAWQCVQNGSFVAIVGESGAGKTTLLADLEARLLQESAGVTLIKPGVLGMEENNKRGQMLKSADILHAIITTLAPTATVPQTLQARTVKAHKLLTASAESGSSHLLVIEEAHGMPDATLKHLKRLHELRQGRRTLLGILLLAQPELKQRLRDGLYNGSLREVAQRCEVVDLLPLDNDLAAYLECRATAAGARLSDLLDATAVAELRLRLTRKTDKGAVSMCYPLAVNNMVTKALNAAADLGVPKVTKDVVASI